MFRFRYAIGAALMLLATAPDAWAQLTCVASASVPLLLRGQGVADLSGDVVLSCTGTSPAGGITGNLTLFLNTNVTSRVLGGVSEALLLIDEPASGAQTPGTNLFQGTISGANQVTFNSIPFAVAPGGAVSRVFRITNVRANGSAIGVSPSIVPSQIVAFVSVTGSATINVSNPQQTVGFVQSALTVESLCVDIGQSTAGLRFTEQFASAFKIRGGTGQSTPGGIYNTETGFTPNPIIAGVGTADSGTQLGAIVSGIPGGVTLSVPALVTSGALALNAITPAGGGPVPVVGGSATIVYEVIGASPLVNDAATIPVTVSTLPLAGALARGNFYPISAVTTASSSAPLPRFADLATFLPFAASCTAVPTMSQSGLLFLAVGLLAVGTVALRRRTAQ
jgi:hypothetical protein